MSTDSFIPIENVVRTIQASRQGAIFNVVLSGLLASLHYEGSNLVASTEGLGNLPILPGAARQMATEHLGVAPATYKQIVGGGLDLDPDFRLDFLQRLVPTRDEIYIVTRQTGDASHAVEGFTAKPGVDNFDIAQSLGDLYAGQVLPADTAAQRLYVSENRRSIHLRLVAPESWRYTVKGDEFYGTVTISNHELTPEKLAVAFGIQRLACTNLAIGDSILDVNKRYSSLGPFRDDFRVGIGGLGDGFDNMRQRLQDLDGIKPKYPYDFARKQLGSMNLRSGAAQRMAEEYMDSHGDDSAYDVLQAVLFAATAITGGGKQRKSPNWFGREAAEAAAWGDIGINYLNAVNEGVDPDEPYMNKDLGLRDVLQRHLRLKAQVYDGQAKTVLEEAAEEVLTIEAD